MRNILLAGIVVTSLTSSLSAQSRPDFSGTWKNTETNLKFIDKDNFSGVLGILEMTVSQDASSIRIDRTYGTNHVSIVLPLNGSKQKYTLDPGSPYQFPRPPRDLVSQAKWRGDKLVIETEYRTAYEMAEKGDHFTTEILSLEGRNLVVERDEAQRNSTNSEGYFRGAMPAKHTYRRVSK